MTVGNSENLLTGNPISTGSIPNYPNFGPNGDALVEFSLLPFQTTGTTITGCFTNGVPCPPNSQQPIVPLPAGVTVDAQTLAQYNSCALPTGTYSSGQPNSTPVVITGASVPGIGQLLQTGPISSTTFVPAAAIGNSQVTVYACRPTVAPAWLNSPLYPGNSLTDSAGVIIPGAPSPWANGNGPFPVKSTMPGVDAFGRGPVPTIAGLTCPLSATSTCTGPNCVPVTKSELGVFRAPTAFLEDSNGSNAYDSTTDRWIPNFYTNNLAPLGGAQASDMAVAGDWTGDGHSKIGIYRQATGQWFLDINNNGIFDGGDIVYAFGGVAGDLPVVGDWAGLGKSCVGLFRSGFLWVLDANCSGAFEGSGAGQDAVFPFGGLAGDVPVVGAWQGGITRVGVVRAFFSGTPLTQQGPPFYWVLDGCSSTANCLSGTVANHPMDTTRGNFPFGGVVCTSTAVPGCPVAGPLLTSDIYVTGDWLGTGTSHAGIYRAGNWIEDLGTGPAGTHTYDTFFQFGGTASDKPLIGKW